MSHWYKIHITAATAAPCWLSGFPGTSQFQLDHTALLDMPQASWRPMLAVTMGPNVMPTPLAAGNQRYSARVETELQMTQPGSV